MSFFSDYKIYAGETELPESYVEWGAIATMSACVAHNVKIPRAGYKISPNLYIVLIAEPGVGKSFALNLVKRLLGLSKTAKMAPSSVTLEALYGFLASEKDGCMITRGKEKLSPLLIAANEIITFLGTDPNRMIEFLTDIWDATEFKVVTKNKGSNIIENPCLTFLGCMTNGKMNTQMMEMFLNGGFSRRCIFVEGSIPSKPVPFLTFSQAQEAALQRCVLKLQEVSKIQGVFTWGADALEFYEEWYKKAHAIMLKHMGSPLGQYYSTLRELIIKVAMLFAVDEGRLILRAADLEQADNVLQQTVASSSNVFASGGKNLLQPVVVAIQKALKRHTSLHKQALVALLFANADITMIEKALAFMVFTRQITMAGETYALAAENLKPFASKESG
jgi:hypothetical protein